MARTNRTPKPPSIYGKFLPSGNRSELPAIVHELVRREIVFRVETFASGSFAVLLPADQLSRLPEDRKGRYLPAGEDRGFTVSPIERASFEDWTRLRDGDCPSPFEALED